MKIKKEFSKEIEYQFINSKQLTNPAYIRGIFVFFIGLYAIFHLVDLIYFADMIYLLVLIRFGIVIPVLLLTVLLTFSTQFLKFNQYLIAIGFFVGGSGVAYMLILRPENVVYSGGLFIVIFSGYLLVKLRYLYASIAGNLIMIFYALGYFITYSYLSTTVFFEFVFLVSANIIGMLGSYYIEKANRQQFLDTTRITEVNALLKQQYQDKNDQLKRLEASIAENQLLQEANQEKDRLAQSLKESESKFRKLFEHAPFGYQSLSPTGHFIEVNQKWLDIFGYQKEEVIGKWFGDFLDEPFKEKFINRFELFKKLGSIHSEFSMMTKRKESIPVSFDGNIAYDEHYNVIQTHCTVSNVTEVNLANLRLKQSEEQYRLLTTEMQLGLALHEMIYDDQGNPFDYRFISINDSYTRLTGLKQDIIGKTLREVLPGTETYWIEKFGEVASTGKSIQYENYSAPLGKYFNTSAYSTKKGQFAVIVEDITERVLADNQRQKEQKDLLTSQKIARLGTWRLDVKTNEVTWSDELYKMFGFDPNQPVPPYTEHMKLFTEKSWETLSVALALTSTQGIPYELELEMSLKDGRKGWMWARGEAEYDESGQIIALTGAAQDITDRRQLEQDLFKTNQVINTILDQSPVAIEFFDANGQHTYSNQSAIDLFGVINPNELKKVNLFQNPNIALEIYQQINNREVIHTEMEYDFNLVKQSQFYQTSKSGQIILEVIISPLFMNSELNGYIVHTKDVTEQRMKANEILYISNHDFLTNIPNRRFFSNHLAELDKPEHHPLGIFMLDINGLKLINDSFGYASGDQIIRYVAEMIRDSVDSNDVVARLGGDEFGIIIPNASADQMMMIQERMKDRIALFSIQEVNISISLGSAIKYDPSETIDHVIKEAEENMYKRKVLESRSMRSAAIKTILETLTNKYDVEKIHSEKVSQYCYEMGTVLQLPKESIEELKLAGLLHDIGKISIPDRILSKPSKLDDDEWEIMKRHTINGYNILHAADEYSNLALYALTHHERYDGTGYPKGLSKDEIPLFSRIISVADAYEAMTADRPYRKALGKAYAIQELIRCKNTQFDPQVVDLFISHVVHNE